jgi:sortase A
MSWLIRHEAGVARRRGPSPRDAAGRRSHWLGRICLTAGLTLLLVYGSHVAKQYAFTTAAAAWSAEFEQETATLVADPPDVSLWSPARVKAFQLAFARQLEAPDAVLSIPRLKLLAPVYEGTDDATLDRGAGHIAGTALLGEDGNIGLAGHRDGFFRSLKDAAIGDTVTMKSRAVTAVYRVDGIKIVSPENVEVLAVRARPSLTLVTCYPFYFQGNAPQRYIVFASLERLDRISDAAEALIHATSLRQEKE